MSHTFYAHHLWSSLVILIWCIMLLHQFSILLCWKNRRSTGHAFHLETLLVHPTETQVFHLHAWIYSPTLPANGVHQAQVLHESIEVAGQSIPCNFYFMRVILFMKSMEDPHLVFGGVPELLRLANSESHAQLQEGATTQMQTALLLVEITRRKRRISLLKI